MEVTKSLKCTVCDAGFTHTRSRHGSWPIRCAECRRQANRERQYRWRAAHPDLWKATQDRSNTKRLADPEYRRDKRDRELRRLYGMEPTELLLLVEKQGGGCAICGFQPPPADDSIQLPRGHASTRLHVDHCHATGRVRGLLCGKCNTMLGLAGEDPKVLLAGVAYLAKE